MFFSLADGTHQVKRLNKSAVPSVSPWTQGVTTSVRAARIDGRQRRKQSLTTQPTTKETNSWVASDIAEELETTKQTTISCVVPDIAEECEITDTPTTVESKLTQTDHSSIENVNTTDSETDPVRIP